MKEKFQDFLIVNEEAKVPKYWGICLTKWHPKGSLRAANRLFDRLGFQFTNGFKDEDWDVLWSVQLPFDSDRFPGLDDKVVKTLKPHQKINHIPGINYITNKKWMTCHNYNIKAVLPGFEFPYQKIEFEKFVAENPDARFVVKHNDNRGVKLVNNSDISFDESKTHFYQYFMERPLLIDGKAMDLSVYFLVSSINPLRIYRFENDILLRFCKEPYHPFDPKNTYKYVVSEDRTDPLDMPSLSESIKNLGFSAKKSIEEVLSKQGRDVTELWEKIDDAATSLILNNEVNMKDKVSF